MVQYNTQAVKKWAKRYPQEIIMLSIMEQYHRSYEQYISTPQYIIDIIKEKNNTDFRLSEHNGN